MAAAWLAHGPLRVSVEIATLAVVVALLLVSTGERLSEEARRPAGWMPALTGTLAPGPVFAPEVGPLEIPGPQARPVAMRRRSSEGPAEIPAPVRRSETAPAPRPQPTFAPSPSTEAVQNADPAAAIDWLLQGGRGRRQTESP
jgi:hypothetical protein